MTPIVLTPEQRQEIERRRKGALDRRIYQRLTAVLAVASGKSRDEVAELLGVGLTQLGEWLRVYRNEGLDSLCALHYKGDPGCGRSFRGAAREGPSVDGAAPGAGRQPRQPGRPAAPLLSAGWPLLALTR
jgi:hypothetical protein